ncbi:MAG TPA: TetR/AcrR family transcriptional regulator [Solirubrobacterales bacterium]
MIRSQRVRILRAMAEAAAERGYAGTTVAQVIEGAGVSRTTFYELFADKEDCFLAAIRDVVARATTAVAEARARPDEDLGSLGAGILALLEFFAAEPAYARLLVLESRNSTPRAVELYLSAVRATVSLIGQGEFASDVPVSSALAARAAYGGAETLISKHIENDRAESLPELLPQLVYCTLVPFRGVDEALGRASLAREKSTMGG